MNSKIRILALFGSRVLFGQERANIETLAQLREQGCKILCLIRDEDWPELRDLREVLDDAGLKWLNTPYIDYPTRGWLLHIIRRNPGAFIRANIRLLQILEEFSATHIHAFNPLYVFNFLGALTVTDLPLVYRCGDKPVRHNMFYSIIWNFTKKRASHFVADSAYIAQELVDAGVDTENISVIYAPAPRRTVRVEFKPPTKAMYQGAFRFVYLGQINENKGVALLIDAFAIVAARHENAHLLIAGPISEAKCDEWASQLRDRVAADPYLADRVHFLGYVDDVPTLLTSCHVHIAPTLGKEPYGLVVLEAKQAKLPSIVFDSGGIAELVNDGVDGMVLSRKDANSLSEALEKYLSMPTVTKANGMAAYESQESLGIGKFAQRWLSVYERVASQGEERQD